MHAEDRVMRRMLLGSLALVAIGAGLAFAGSEPCGCQAGPQEGPTVPLRPILLWRQPQPPPPCEGPTTPFVAPVLFRREVEQPTWTECPPRPPVVLMRGSPPAVTLVRGAPPPIKLFRQEPTPPEWTQCPPRPPVVLFRRTPEQPTWAPTQTIPAVVICRQPQPRAPCEPPPCPHACGDVSTPSNGDK